MRTSIKNRIKSASLALLMIITSLGTQFMSHPMVVHAADKVISIPIEVNFYTSTGKLDSDGIAPKLEFSYKNEGTLIANYNSDGNGGYNIESSNITVGDFENDTTGNFNVSFTMPAEDAPAIKGYKFRGWTIDIDSSASPRATEQYYASYCTGNACSPKASNATITFDLQKVYQKTASSPYDPSFALSELNTDEPLQAYSINIVPVYGKLNSVEVNFSGSEVNTPFKNVIYEDDLYDELGTVVLPNVEDVVEAVDTNREYYWVIENNIMNEDWDIYSTAIYMESAETQRGAEIVFKPGASLKIRIISSDDADETETYYPYNFRLESIDKTESYLYCVLDENKNGVCDQTENEIQGALESVSYNNGDDFNEGKFGTYLFNINIEDELENTASSTFNGWKYDNQIYKKGVTGQVSISGEDMEDGACQIMLVPDFVASVPYSITHEGAIYENKGDAADNVAYAGATVILSPVTAKDGYSWALFKKSGETLTYDDANSMNKVIDGSKVSFTMPESDVVAKYLPVLSVAGMENGLGSLTLTSGTQMILDGGSFGSNVVFRNVSTNYSSTIGATSGNSAILNVPGDSGVWYEADFVNVIDSPATATFIYKDAQLTVIGATSQGKTLTAVNTYIGEKIPLVADAGAAETDLYSWMELETEYPVSELTDTSLPFSVVDGVVYYTVSNASTDITVKPVYKAKRTVTVDGEVVGSYYEGESVTLNSNATAYKVFKNWKVTLGEVNIINSRFTMPDSNVEIVGEYDVYDTTFSAGQTLRLASGVPYVLGSGKYKVNNDITTYMGGSTFYVTTAGEYTFTEE